MRRILLCVAMFGIVSCTSQKVVQEPEVKNIIYMIGDGMGLAHVSMLQIEGGYEPTCHLEYCLVGPFKKGLNKLYFNEFQKAYEKISK